MVVALVWDAILKYFSNTLVGPLIWGVLGSSVDHNVVLKMGKLIKTRGLN